MDKIEKLSRKFLNDSDIEAGMIVAHMKNGRTMRAFTGNMVDISVLYAVGIIELAKQSHIGVDALQDVFCKTIKEICEASKELGDDGAEAFMQKNAGMFDFGGDDE